jgi:hypothetical protein
MLAHFTGKVSEHLVLVIEFYTEHCSRKDCRDSSFQLNRFFAAHGSRGLEFSTWPFKQLQPLIFCLQSKAVFRLFRSFLLLAIASCVGQTAL